MLLADELEQLPRIRILLGAEPVPDPLIPTSNDAALQGRISAALHNHVAWLKAERDALRRAIKAGTIWEDSAGT